MNTFTLLQYHNMRLFTIKYLALFTLCIFLLCSFVSCGTIRGIPSHGGGKRFDEEQRVVAASIRQTVADMKLDALSGKRVRIVFNTMSHSGGGHMQWPGLQSINIGANHTSEDNDETRENHSGAAASPWDPNYRDINDIDRLNINGSINYRVQENYRAFWAPTSSDERYLQGVLSMYLSHHGVIIDNQNPELFLHILVDVLGTNRSRSNYLLWSKDILAASCELTYYATGKSGAIMLPAQRCGASAQYSESSALLISGIGKKRKTSDMPESMMPLPSPSSVSEKQSD